MFPLLVTPISPSQDNGTLLRQGGCLCSPFRYGLGMVLEAHPFQRLFNLKRDRRALDSDTHRPGWNG